MRRTMEMPIILRLAFRREFETRVEGVEEHLHHGHHHRSVGQVLIGAGAPDEVGRPHAGLAQHGQVRNSVFTVKNVVFTSVS